MSKTTKAWLTLSVFLILAGCVLFVGVMATLKWDFTKLSTSQYEVNRYVISESFRSVSVDTRTADIVFAASEDGKCKVVCYEEEAVKHTVSVKDGTLVIETENAQSWTQYIGISFTSPKITLYLPEGEYEALSVKSETGDVQVPGGFSFQSADIEGGTGRISVEAGVSGLLRVKLSTGDLSVKSTSVGSLELSTTTGRIMVSDVSSQGDILAHVSTGHASLENVTCKNLTSTGSTGGITLSHVIAAEKITVTRDTGHVKFDASDAAQIAVQTDTGDVSGTLLSEKVFIAKSDTGSVNVPNSATGGRCEITTDTGDIQITVSPNRS